MGTCEVARFERAGDIRRMMLEQTGDGLVVREDLSGPSVSAVYGDEWRSMRAAFAAAAVGTLLDAVGSACEGASLQEYLSDEGHDIVDLMDLCDVRGVPYSFVGMGSGSDIQFRPAK